MPDIITTASRVVYRNRWMELREDEIIHPNGSPGTYSYVHKADFSLVIPATDTGFYLVEQYRYTTKGRFFEFPQGSWEDTPTADPADLARGELAEETGLRTSTLRLLGTIHEAYGLSDHRGHVYLATDLIQGPTQLSPEEADLRCQHVTFNEFPRFVTEGRITDAATIAAYALLFTNAGHVADADLLRRVHISHSSGRPSGDQEHSNPESSC